MVPVSLSVRNFLSYGEDVPPLDFTSFHVACIMGGNGHGKSALVDAVSWALWGQARKAPAERKPDDGLLRVGATEMHVAFEFTLDEEHYRIYRSYRKTRRGGTSALELQVPDPTDGTYRALSERGSVRKTQERIEDLLRMTYDTFITSVFILQGRADEFTRRNARERKTILGEILGLSRYDGLCQLARDHLQRAEADAGEARARVDEIEAAVAEVGQLRSQLASVAKALGTMEGDLTRRETQLQDLRTELARFQMLRCGLADLGSEMADLKEQGHGARTEADSTRLELVEFRGMLARQEEILGDFDLYRSLQLEDKELQGKLRKLRVLEHRRNELERHISEARHGIERQIEGWEVRISAARKEIEDAGGILSARAEVEEGIGALREARTVEASYEARREQRDAVVERVRCLERDLDSARSRLQAALNAQKEERRRLEGVSAQHSRSQQAIQDARRQADEVRDLDGKRARIRERGTALRAEVEAARERLVRLNADRDEIHRQRASLADLREVRCPLCSTALDADHRATVETELARKYASLTAEIEELNSRMQGAEAERERCRCHYQEVKNRLAVLEGAANRLAASEVALREVEAARDSLREMAEGVRSLESRLGALDAESAEARGLAEARTDLESLGYDPQAHRALRDRIREMATFEAKAAQVQMAEERRRRAAGDLPELSRQRAAAAAQLVEGRYARPAHEELGELKRDMETLGYDPERHAESTRSLETLADAAEARERLLSAEGKLDGVRARLQAAEDREREIARRMERLRARTTELGTSLEAEGAAEKQAGVLQSQIQDLRARRDGLVQERAKLQAQLERCEALERSLDGQRNRLQAAGNDIRIFRELAGAFGKDGIPALLIEQAIPEIEGEANRILSRLTDNRAHIALESLKDLKTGGTRETLDIHISDELGERRYELYSGGEAFRVDFAIRIAISKLLARRAGTRLRTLVIDEGFGTQDAEGLDNMVEAIQTITDDFEKILVITHVEPLKQVFPVRIEVTKHPYVGSRYEVFQ